MSLNKRERKNVRALFRDQRSLSTQFLEQVTNVTNVANMTNNDTTYASRSHHGRLHRGHPNPHQSSSLSPSIRHDHLEREVLKQEMLSEVNEWSRVPLDILSCISLDAHSTKSKHQQKF